MHLCNSGSVEVWSQNVHTPPLSLHRLTSSSLGLSTGLTRLAPSSCSLCKPTCFNSVKATVSLRGRMKYSAHNMLLTNLFKKSLWLQVGEQGQCTPIAHQLLAAGTSSDMRLPAAGAHSQHSPMPSGTHILTCFLALLDITCSAIIYDCCLGLHEWEPGSIGLIAPALMFFAHKEESCCHTDMVLQGTLWMGVPQSSGTGFSSTCHGVRHVYFNYW